MAVYDIVKKKNKNNNKTKLTLQQQRKQRERYKATRIWFRTPGILGVIGSSAVKGAAACPMWSLPSILLLSHPLSSHPLSTSHQHILNRKAQSQRCANYLLLLTWEQRQECARLKTLLKESPNFPQFGWLSNGASWVGKVKETTSLSLWCFFEDTPTCPIKDQSLRHGPKPSPAGQKVCI